MNKKESIKNLRSLPGGRQKFSHWTADASKSFLVGRTLDNGGVSTWQRHLLGKTWIFESFIGHSATIAWLTNKAIENTNLRATFLYSCIVASSERSALRVRVGTGRWWGFASFIHMLYGVVFTPVHPHRRVSWTVGVLEYELSSISQIWMGYNGSRFAH